MNRNKIESKLLIEDIVKAKGYNVYKDWKRKKRDVSDLHSLNTKINQHTTAQELETKKEPVEPFKQLEFKF